MKLLLSAAIFCTWLPTVLFAQSLNTLPSSDSIPISIVLSSPLDTLTSLTDTLRFGLDAKRDSLRETTDRVNDLIDTVRQPVQRIYPRWSSYPDSLLTRIDSLAQPLGQSSVMDSLRGEVRARARDLRQKWEQETREQSLPILDDQVLIQESVDKVNDYRQKYSVDLTAEEVLNSMDNMTTEDDIPPEASSLPEQYSEIQSEVENLKKDSAQQVGPAIDQRIDQYASEQEELHPLMETNDAEPSPIQQSLQGYQTQLDQTSLNKAEVQQLLVSRLQALGGDYQQDFQQRIKRSTRKLARHRSAYQVPPSEDTLAKSGKKRFRVGGNFQLQPGRTTRLDISPELQYRLLSRWNIGLGGTYRVGIQTDAFPRRLIQQEGIYGIRGLTEWQAFPSVSLRAEWESLYNGATPTNQLGSPASELLTQLWSNSIWLGPVKYYSVTSWVKGSVQLLYNPLHDPKTDLYTQAYTIRMGFQLQPSVR